MTDAPSNKPYHETTANEAEEIRRTLETPGWAKILTRLHWAQAETLQQYLDTKDDGILGEFRGLKRAEKLAYWMLLDPVMRSKVKSGANVVYPYEGVTAEDIARLEEPES
jgi:hypothetical protein